METKSPQVLDQVRATLRTMHYSYRTEQACVDWIKDFKPLYQVQHLPWV